MRDLVFPIGYTLVVYQVDTLLNRGKNKTDAYHDDLGAKSVVVAVLSQSVCPTRERLSKMRYTHNEGLSSAR